jgi:hypothetical protein
MLLQDRDALRYALVTDMCGCARDKTGDRSGVAAAKRAPQTRVPPQHPPERREASHVATHRFLGWSPDRGRRIRRSGSGLRPEPIDSQLAGVSSSSS